MILSYDILYESKLSPNSRKLTNDTSNLDLQPHILIYKMKTRNDFYEALEEQKLHSLILENTEYF